MVSKHAWVRIHQILLKPEERANNLPEETKKVPLELWVKGFLTADAEIGSEVEVTTLTGRLVKGTLLAVNPAFDPGFGDFVPEILTIDRLVKDTLFGGRS
jgi:hypothetical protein